MSKKQIIGPVTLEARVHFACDDKIGYATYGLSPASPVTGDRLVEVVKNVLKALPEGARLLEPDEFFNLVLVPEKTGQRGNFAVPAGFHYSVEELTGATS